MDDVRVDDAGGSSGSGGSSSRSDALETSSSSSGEEDEVARRRTVDADAAAAAAAAVSDRTEAMSYGEVAAAVALVPPRVALAVALCLCLLFLSAAAMVVHALLPEALAAGPVGRSLLLPLRALVRCTLLIAGFWHVSVVGAPPADDRRLIYAANHQSSVDVLYVLYALAPSFVAKEEVLKIPFVGQAARALRCVFVDRLDAASRRAGAHPR